MMKATLAAAMLTIAACAGSPFSSVSDNSARLATYKTYRWISQGEAEELRLQQPRVEYLTNSIRVIRKPEIEKKVRSMVEEDLTHEGYQPSPGLQPDFFVTFYAKAKDEDWVSSWEGYTPSVMDVPLIIFPELNRTEARKHVDGTVYLTFYDAKSKKPVWTGSVISTRFGPQFGEPEVRTAVNQIVTEFSQSSRDRVA